MLSGKIVRRAAQDWPRHAPNVGSSLCSEMSSGVYFRLTCIMPYILALCRDPSSDDIALVSACDWSRALYAAYANVVLEQQHCTVSNWK
jgi:hypothetical protein